MFIKTKNFNLKIQRKKYFLKFTEPVKYPLIITKNILLHISNRYPYVQFWITYNIKYDYIPIQNFNGLELNRSANLIESYRYKEDPGINKIYSNVLNEIKNIKQDYIPVKWIKWNKRRLFNKKLKKISKRIFN